MYVCLDRFTFHAWKIGRSFMDELGDQKIGSGKGKCYNSGSAGCAEGVLCWCCLGGNSSCYASQQECAGKCHGN